MANQRSRNIDSARRDDRRAGTCEEVEVVEVYPQTDIFIPPASGDIKYNTVDVQLIDRIIPPDGVFKPQVLHRIPVMQFRGGKYQGDLWLPRIGDLVLLYWIRDDEGLIIGTKPAAEQPPLCRSKATSEDQEVVRKLCPFKHPKPNSEGNYTEFPDPDHPDCFKWWPLTRDSITIFDCPHGTAEPSCRTCDDLDCLTGGTYIKNFSDISPTLLDKKWRFKFHHHCGSIWYFDEDGDFHIQGAVAGDLRGFIHHHPSGTLTAKSCNEAPSGSMLLVVADADSRFTDDVGEVAAELEHVPSASRVRIYKNGKIQIVSCVAGVAKSLLSAGPDGYCEMWNIVSDAYVEIQADGTINLTSPTSINLNAPVVNVNDAPIGV